MNPSVPEILIIKKSIFTVICGSLIQHSIHSRTHRRTYSHRWIHYFEGVWHAKGKDKKRSQDKDRCTCIHLCARATLSSDCKVKQEKRMIYCKMINCNKRTTYKVKINHSIKTHYPILKNRSSFFLFFRVFHKHNVYPLLIFRLRHLF